MPFSKKPWARIRQRFCRCGLNVCSWLNEHNPLRKWSVGDDVRCRGCGGVFKAERVASDSVGEPTCPHCIGSTPADFEKVLPGQKV